MDHFAWDAAYSTGNAKIDEEHQRIFLAANLLHKAIQNKEAGAIMDKCLTMLMDYTVFHFNREIDYFKSIHSSAVNEQKRLHDELVQELVAIRKNQGKITDYFLGLELETWMVDRLLPHIKEKDVLALKSVPNQNPF